MISPEAYKNVIARHARAFHRKLAGAGIFSHTVEDIEQEFWIAWMTARDSFDETKGVPFDAYLFEGLRLTKHVIRRKTSRRYAEEVGASLDQTNEDGLALLDTIADDAEPFHVEIERRDVIKALCGRLSARSAAFLSLLYHQPAALHQAAEGLRRRAEYARSMGVVNVFQGTITSAIVFKAMGAPRPERDIIKREITAAIGV